MKQLMDKDDGCVDKQIAKRRKKGIRTVKHIEK